MLSVGVFASHTFAQSRESSVQFHFLRLAAPPLAAQLSRAEKGLSSAQQKAYCERLKLEQSALLKVLQNGPIKVLYRYQKVLNGLQVQCSGCTQEELLALPGVEEVHPVLILETHLDNSVPHIGAGSALEAAGIDGQGVNIGIIDSGVDYLHAAFGGLGKIEAYAANDAASIDDSFLEKPLFPTAKVVGGHDFVGLGYVPGQVAAKPDPDPCPTINCLKSTVNKYLFTPIMARMWPGLPPELEVQRFLLVWRRGPISGRSKSPAWLALPSPQQP